MAEDPRREREMKAALDQIRAVQTRAGRRWRLDVSVGRLAAEGIAVFLLAFLVGRGLASLFLVVRSFFSG